MKKILILLLLFPVLLNAQEMPLMVEGVSPALHVIHSVQPKENYYSIGRIYNVSPKDIAPFNKLQLDAGLSIGQQIKIPLTDANFNQDGSAGADETLVPLYYKVKDKEGLYRVALNHNNLAQETLKKWNHITGDALKSGTTLIVGYLKVKTELSVLAKNGIVSPVETQAAVVEKKLPENKPEKTVTAKEVVPPVTIKETPVAVTKEPAASDIVKTVKAPVVSEVKKTPLSGKTAVGGAFKGAYESQSASAEMQEAEGEAGVFKSTSGWADGKYYCLFNAAAPGTIVKVANPANGKFIFAKVLDLIPDIKQNEGLVILISNAAAEKLGAEEGKFVCTVNYAK